MRIWNKDLAESTPKLYQTEDIATEDKIVVAKFFALGTNMSWYIVEAEEREGDVIFFGYIDNGPWSEWGYASLNELESIDSPYGTPAVERDLYFKPKRFGDLFPDKFKDKE